MKFKFFSNYQSFKPIAEDAIEFVTEKLSNFKTLQSHTLDHVFRVLNMAFFLAQKLDAFIDVIVLSAIFHDVGRPLELESGESHAEISARIAESFLKDKRLDAVIPDITHAIRSHRFNGNILPNTVEAKILQDADALDALGGVGLFRAISFAVENNNGIEVVVQHCHEKLFLLPGRMHFPISRRIANKRVKLLRQFVKQVSEETSMPSLF